MVPLMAPMVLLERTATPWTVVEAGYSSLVTLGWKQGGPSPFLTERARIRAPQVIQYAAVPGAAMLVSPAGAVVLWTGDAGEVDAVRVARSVAGLGARHEVTSFRIGTACVHAAPVCHGWMLCVLSTSGVNPSFVIERLRRASYVLALALVDGVAPGGPGDAGSGGAPAEVSAALLPARKN